MIKEFCSHFTDKVIDNVITIGRAYYLVDDNLNYYINKINRSPESAGVYLGQTKKGKFMPSIPLLDILAQTSDKKLVINGRAEWLFLCGRDLMAGSISSSNVKKGLVLVENERGEILGIGNIIANLKSKGETIVVKNIIDRGDFLRREMD